MPSPLSRPSARPDSSRLSAALLAAALVLAQPRAARAENEVTYEHADYREFGGRIGVQTDSAVAEQDLGTDMHLKLTGVIDTITGATPTGQPAPAHSDQVVITPLSDRRHAWNAELSRQLPRVDVTVGFARSIEHDYMSNGWSLNTATDFNQKNTTLLLGASGTDDNVETFFKSGFPWVRKVSNDAILGVNQLLNPQTSVALDFTWARETGFLNDQYKLVQEDIQIFPGLSLPETFAENRPNERNKGTLYATMNRSFASWDGALQASYRLYHDTYGINSQTAEVLWFQHLGSRVILRPNLRFYQQSAAHFYTYQMDDTGIIPTRVPNPAGPHYSSDARLSALQSLDFGAKAIWNLTDHWEVHVALEGYRQRGTDGITPQSAYYRARIFTTGAKVSW